MTNALENVNGFDEELDDFLDDPGMDDDLINTLMHNVGVRANRISGQSIGETYETRHWTADDEFVYGPTGNAGADISRYDRDGGVDETHEIKSAQNINTFNTAIHDALGQDPARATIYVDADVVIPGNISFNRAGIQYDEVLAGGVPIRVLRKEGAVLVREFQIQGNEIEDEDMGDD